MTKVTKRRSQSGIVLISTLLSLSLLTMFALTIQAKSIASAKTYRKLIQATEVDAAQAAVRELVRPLILEAMIDFERETQLRLNSTPFEMTWRGRSLMLVAQDVEGMLNLRRPWQEDLMLLVPGNVKSIFANLRLQVREIPEPLRMQLAKARTSETATLDILETWISDQGNEINPSTLIVQRNGHPTFLTRQPNLVIVSLR